MLYELTETDREIMDAYAAEALASLIAGGLSVDHDCGNDWNPGERHYSDPVDPDAVPF